MLEVLWENTLRAYIQARILNLPVKANSKRTNTCVRLWLVGYLQYIHRCYGRCTVQMQALDFYVFTWTYIKADRKSIICRIPLYVKTTGKYQSAVTCLFYYFLFCLLFKIGYDLNLKRHIVLMQRYTEKSSLVFTKLEQMAYLPAVEVHV